MQPSDPSPEERGPATPLPAPDPMDEVVGRVRDYVEATKQYHDTDDVDMTTGGLLFADLRALLAAYQSVRSENARMREVLQNLADDDGYCDFVSIARDALSRTGGTE